MIKCNSRRLRFLFSPWFSPCTSSAYARVSCRDELFVVFLYQFESFGQEFDAGLEFVFLAAVFEP